MGLLDAPVRVPVSRITDAVPMSGLVALFDFQHDLVGGNAVTSRVGKQPITLTARGSKTVVKDAADPGPFGPSLVLDGATVFAKTGALGALDPSTVGDQVTVVAWVKDSAANHDDGANGIAFRAGSHDDVTPARQYGIYFDGNGFIWSKGHLTPHIGAQDGASPGYPFSHDQAASARKYFTGTGQGQWHMEAMTFDGAQIIAYVDGLTDSWLAVPEPPPSVLSLSDGSYTPQVLDRNPFTLRKGINRSQTAKIFTIGGTCDASSTGINFTTGKIGGVAVFNRALSAAEIMQIRLATLLSGEAITSFGFEVASTGSKALKRAGWTAKADTNIDVSLLTSTGPEYAITRPAGGTKAYLTKTSTLIGAAWGAVTGLNSSQVRRLRFKMLSALTTSAAQRLLVKVGSQWWASNTTYAATGAHAGDTDWTGAETKTHTVDWSPGNWKAVTMLDTPTAAAYTNLAQNPSVSVNATNWFKASAAANATATGRTSDGAGGWVYRLTWTGADAAAGAGGGLNHPAITGITAGSMYSASMVAKCSKAQLLHLEINWYDSSGTFLSTVGGGVVSVLANTATTLVATGIAPATAVKMLLKVSPPASGGTAWANTDTLDMTKALVVAGSALPAYFDGDTALAAWSGTAGASTSALTTTGAGTYQNLALNPSLSANATNWFKSSSAANATATGRTASGGGFVYRLTWTGTDVSGSGIALGGLSNAGISPIVAGNLYAASMLVTPSRNAKLFVSLQWMNAGGGTVSITDGGTVAVGAGIPTTLTVNGVAPATATQLLIKVSSAEFSWLSGDTFDMTNMLVVNGSVLPAYFDGGSTNGAWAGTAGASASNVTGVVLGTLALASGTNAAWIDNAAITAVGFLSSGGDGSAVRVSDLELLPT